MLNRLRIQSILILVIACQSVYCQTVLELQRNNRRAKILKKHDCLFETIPVSNDGKVTKRLIYFGNLVSVKDSILSIKSFECNTVTINADGKSTVDYNLYADTAIINLHLRDINSIETDKKWFIIPALIGSFGLISAVIVSPIASSNFKERTFNTDKFAKISGYSLLTSTVCFTVAYTIAIRKYVINPPDNKRKYKLWHIKSVAGNN